MSYADLDHAARRVAGCLQAAGVRRGDMVGLYSARSVDAVIATLGILYAGAGYVPLDPTHAPEQLAFIAEDLSLATVLVAPDWATDADRDLGVDVTRIPLAEAIGFAATGAIVSDCGGEDVAYVMYTSGTTGRPKGVAVPHRAILAYGHAQPFMQMRADDVVLHFLTIACDGATFEIWAALLNGASIAVVEAQAPSLDDIASAMIRHSVSAVGWYAGIHHMMIDQRLEAFATVRLNIAGGDVMSPAHAARLLEAWPDILLINSYGPTEATVGALYCHVTPEVLDGGPIPIGRAYDRYDAFVVDEALRVLPEGETGQLVLAGGGVALGYHNRPDRTATSFVPDPRPGKGGTVYLTGDLARQSEDGSFAFAGRVDRQVKLGGRRIELDGVEHVLRTQPGVRGAAVVLLTAERGDRRIAAALLAEDTDGSGSDLIDRVLKGAAEQLHPMTLPRQVRVLPRFPLTSAGKVDRRAVAELLQEDPDVAPDTSVDAADSRDVRALIADVWDKLLGCGPVSDDTTFFDAGGNSLQLMEAHAALETALGMRFPITQLFDTPRLGQLARVLGATAPAETAAKARSVPSADTSDLPAGAIAIVGMAARLPGSASVEDFWEHLRRGDNLIDRFSVEELEDNHDAATRADPAFVPARSILPDADMFDARFFGVLPREAEQMDPQARVFLELCQQALEDAGIDPARAPGAIGVWAGSSPSTYLLANLLSGGDDLRDYTSTYQSGDYHRLTGNSTDSLATRVAYKLDLKGPAMSVGTACSTSLTAISQAVQALRSGGADVAMAGGVSITFPQKRGYLALEGGMASPHGLCRPFDAQADGTVFGHGAGVVVLRRLEDALADGDPIHAVIRGVGLNNDGADKISYTAPSVDGQAGAIRMAHSDAGLDPTTISYVECHGTATPLGDPVELMGLARAFGPGAEGRCAIGSVKGNIGHLDAAAGVVSVIKTAMMLTRAEIPPVANFRALNPRIDLDGTPFRVADRLTDWACNGPRRAGISSFGVGGTNAHLVLEQAPSGREAASITTPQALPLAAKSAEALAEMTTMLADRLKRDDAPDLAEVALTLQRGRSEFPWRLAVAASDPATAIAKLRRARPPATKAPSTAPEVVFMFPGQGSQYPGMGSGLYAAEPAYARWIDRGAEILRPIIGQDLTALLTRADLSDDEAARALRDTRLTQPALFIVQYGCARVWMDRGITPAAMVGHSVGEFTAAALAGVMDFETGLRIIAARGQLMQDQPGGAMLSVRAPLEALEPHLFAGVELAAMNAPKAQVVAGPFDAIEQLELRLSAAGIAAKRLHTSHAFHSAMMDPVVSALETEISGVALAAPTIPLVSSVTGDWLTDKDARSPAFWAAQARASVNFQAALQAVCEEASRVLVEMGAGGTLSAFATQTLGRGGFGGVFQSLTDHTQTECDVDAMASAFANLWAAGVPVDWSRLGPAATKRVSVPGTAFQRKRYWVEPPQSDAARPVSIPAAASVAAAPVAYEEPMTETSPTPQAERGPRLTQELLAMLSDLSGEDLGAADAGVPFLELGFDSLFMGQVSQAIGKTYGVEVTFRTLLAEMPSVELLSAHLDNVLPPEEAAPVHVATPAPAAAPTAVGAPVPVAGATPAPVAPLAGDIGAVMQAQMQAMQSLFSEQLRVLGGGSPVVAPVLPQPAPVQPAPAPMPASTVATAGTSMSAPPTGGFKTGRGPDVSGGALDAAQAAFVADLARRYSDRFAKSKAYTADHRGALADPRTVSGFRAEWKELTFPVVVEEAQGAYFKDADGNRLIDLVNGFGQTAFGHSPDFVSRAVADQMTRGYPIGPQSDLAGPVADRFARLTGHERVTFCNTGSEAVMAAMRLARTVTGREKVVVFSGDYHGQFDEVLVKGKSRGGAPAALPIAPGIPRSGLTNMTVLAYGAPESLDWLRENAHDIAAVLVEAVQSRHPNLRPADFVREVRRITAQSGTALVMDEVVTGFRTHMRGMQGVWDIKADMATYGKVVGGGMPIGVLAGDARFMDALDGGTWQFGDDSKPEIAPTFFAGTFVRHPLVLAAVDAVLRHLETDGEALFSDTAARAARLADDLRAALARRGLPDLVESYSSWFVLNVTQRDPRATLLYALMRMEGVHVLDGFCGFLTTAHTDADCAEVLRAFETALDALQSVGILIGEPADSATSASTTPAPTTAIPLTENQREIWMVHQLGDLPACSFNESVSVHLDGALDMTALKGALDDLVARHDALRMVFSRDGQQFDIAEAPELPFEAMDLREEADPQAALAGALDRDARTPVDITNGIPLRAAVFRLDDAAHILILTAHHIAVDGWSYGVMFEDLAAFYSARVDQRTADLPPAPSFAAHAMQMTGKGASAATRAFWKKEYKTVPPLPELPTDMTRPAIKSYEGATTHGGIDAATLKAVRKAGAKLGCTLFGTLFGALQVTLGRLTGSDDVVIGVPTGGQAQLEDQSLVGHCVNMLPVRAPFARTDSLGAHLTRVSGHLLETFDHQDTTYGALVRDLEIERSLNRMPLTEVQFNLERSAGAIPMGPVTARPVTNAKAAANFDLFFNVVESADGLRVDVDYNSALYTAATVERWIGHFANVLKSLVADAQTPIAELRLMDGARVHDLVDIFNDTTMPYDSAATLTDLVARSCAARPDAVAIKDSQGAMTYGALAARSDSLAALLQETVPTPGQRIAVALPRGAGMLAGLIAVMKAGHAYVPLDPDQPAERLRQIVDTAQVAAVLGDGSGMAFADAAGIPVIDANAAQEGAAPAPVARDPMAPAYVIFTSGSTGTPKGVEIPHRAVVNFLTSMLREPGLSADDSLLAVTTVMFDIAVLELFGPLVAGGRVVIADRSEVLDGFRLAERAGRDDITVLQATPTLWSMLLEAGLEPRPGLKMLAGGEPLADDLADRLLQGGGALWNMYGPTETTIWSALKQLSPGAPVTIGGPIGNTELHVLDTADQVAPIGVVGELNIGGDGLARGYYGRADLTEAAFRDVHLDGRARRLYRTGDLAMRLTTGEIRVLGRIDTQVKLRGYRIELGEIETRLRAVPGVTAAAVALRARANGDKRLVGYLVAEPGATLDHAEVRAALATQMPDYMVPQMWVDLTALPQTGNGKLDRKALPEPEDTATITPLRTAVTADTETERRIAEIWAGVLGVEEIGVTDTLYALGADSLVIFRIAARMLDDGLNLEARHVLAHPTIRELAMFADSRAPADATSSRPSLRDFRQGARRNTQKVS